MELRWLEDYIALARTRHFSRAAEAQNVTQPTFSRRIKLLEDEMGMVLVDRNTLPLSLTPAGEAFLAFAEETYHQFKQTQEQIAQISQQQHNKLLVAATQTLYLCFFQQWAEACEAESLLNFNLNSASWSSSDFSAALVEQRTDLALCHWHPSMHNTESLYDSALEYRTLARDRLLPLSLAIDGKPKFQFPGRAKKPLPYIDYQEKSYFHGVLQMHLSDRQPPLHLLTMNRNRQSVSVKALVMEGYGIGWLPEQLVQRELVAGLLALASEDESIELEIRVYRNPQNKKPKLQQFWDSIQSSQ